MKLLYCCYSKELHEFLSSKGMRYELCALNPNSKKIYWAYLRCEELDKYLNEWRSN